MQRVGLDKVLAPLLLDLVLPLARRGPRHGSQRCPWQLRKVEDPPRNQTKVNEKGSGSPVSLYLSLDRMTSMWSTLMLATALASAAAAAPNGSSVNTSVAYFSLG